MAARGKHGKREGLQGTPHLDEEAREVAHLIAVEVLRHGAAHAQECAVLGHLVRVALHAWQGAMPGQQERRHHAVLRRYGPGA